MSTVRFLVAFTTSFILVSVAPVSPYPQKEISNGIIRVKIYLPDAAKGYYRATRFDWSGVIPEIEYNGHSFCGQWFEKYDPLIHDAIMGPVEAFSPLNYDQATVGEHFITIGVGVLLKENNAPYSPFQYHKILNAGKWKVNTKRDGIELIHILNDPEFSYEYKKNLYLSKDKPELILFHQLKNTGRNIIETEVYDHNMFLFDHEQTGPQYTIEFPFSLVEKKEGQGLGDLVSIKNNQISVNRNFLKTEQAYTRLEGFNKTSEDYNIKIENHHSGAAVNISADRPISKLIFWACSTILCPEPYMQLKVNPGETVSWKISYKFYTCNIQ
jgi:ribosomal protein S17